MGCCVGIARFLLIVFNFIFWLSGAAIIGFAIWILVDPDIEDYQKVIEDASSDGDFLEVGAYILIGFGAFVFLVGFCGCCGAIRKSKCLLGIYILCLVLICAGELAAGIYVAIKRGDVEDDLDDRLYTSFQKSYSELKGPWDFVQSELECCGVNGPKDYNDTSVTKEPDPKVPASCCKAVNGVKNVTMCQSTAFTSNPVGVYTSGCLGELKDWVKDNGGYVMGVGIGIAALEIIGLVCAIIFCRNIREGNMN